MTERPRVSKWVLAIARWAILFGLIGVGALITGWVQAARSGVDTNPIKIIGTAFLALAFVLAPFVRNAFGLPTLSARKSRSTHRTRLDELRAGIEADEVVQPHTEIAPPLTLFARFVIGLYVVFGIVLVAALWTM